MRPIDTRLSCLGLFAFLVLGAPAAATSQGSSDAAPTRAQLLAQMRACSDWFAEAAVSSDPGDWGGMGSWASDARFPGCRRVIADALAHLDAREGSSAVRRAAALSLGPGIQAHL